MQTNEAPNVSLTSVSVGNAPAQVYSEEFRVIVVWNTIAITPPLRELTSGLAERADVITRSRRDGDPGNLDSNRSRRYPPDPGAN